MFVIKVIRKGRRSDKRERQEEKDETISNFLHVNEFSFLSVCFYLYGLRSEMENLLSQLWLHYIKNIYICQQFL